MAEEELLPFDMKKKKKKKKTGFDPDALEPAEPAVDTATEEPDKDDAEIKAEQAQEKAEDDDFSLDFDSTKKKKKKKKQAIDLEELKEALPTEESEKKDEEEAAEDGGADFDMDGDPTLLKKKKKKKRVKDIDELTKDDPDVEEDNFDAVDSAKKLGGRSWSGTDRDYTYDELLTRVFSIIKEKNPEMVTGEKKKIVMRPPQVLRAGARRTSFANFAEISRMLHRQSKHVLAFLLAELGTSGSVDGNNQLIIKGRFNQKQIENVLRRYIKEYVTCHTCKSPDTLLQKEERLFFLQCETCGSRCSVASIKSGFQAVTGRRAAMRANAQ